MAGPTELQEPVAVMNDGISTETPLSVALSVHFNLENNGLSQSDFTPTEGCSSGTLRNP